MSHPLPRERILDLWAQGKTGTEIGDIIGHHSCNSILHIISDARLAGDSRAVARGKPRSKQAKPAVCWAAAPEKSSDPPLHKTLGIKTKTVRVMAPASSSVGVSYVYVTLPSLGRFDNPEREAR